MDKYTKAVLAVVVATLMSGCGGRWEAVNSKQVRSAALVPYPYKAPGTKLYFEFATVGEGLKRYLRVTCENPFGIPSEYLPKVVTGGPLGLMLYKKNSFSGYVIIDHKTLAKYWKQPEIDVKSMSSADVLEKLGDHENCKGLVDGSQPTSRTMDPTIKWGNKDQTG